MPVLVLHFQLYRNNKKAIKTTRNIKEKYNRIFVLARSKLNSIESKTSKALKNNKNMKAL